MTRLVSVELLKVRTQRAMKVVLILGFALTMLSLASQIAGYKLGDIEVSILASDFYQRGLLSASGGSTLLMVFVVMGITSEYRHRTITSTFLAVPDRSRVLIAKLLTYLLITIVYWLFLAVATTGVVLAFLSIENVALAVGWGRINLDYLRDLAGLGLHATFAFAIGALVANQIGSVVAVLVEPIVSTIVYGFVPKVGRFLPTPSLDAFIREQITVPNPIFEVETLSPTQGVAIFGAYTVALLVAAFVVTIRRDIT